VAVELSGAQLSAITREIVRIKAEHYGRGPTEGKSYLCDEVVFCVLRDGLTAVEKDLCAHGDHDLVRTLRMRFQDNNRDLFQGMVERISGFRVLTYQSQVLFDPDHIVEIFVLGERLEEGSTPDAGAAGSQ
jgi:uncharacterized protein YbcI